MYLNSQLRAVWDVLFEKSNSPESEQFLEFRNSWNLIDPTQSLKSLVIWSEFLFKLRDDTVLFLEELLSECDDKREQLPRDDSNMLQN